MVERSIMIAFLSFALLVFNGVRAEAFHHSSSRERINLEEQPYRTAFHFQPPQNWMNDPNGPMYYNGVYHLFYQYNPNSPRWGNINWAHSVSYDLVNWIHLNPALTPSDPYDLNGCWSGSATLLADKPAILYTGNNHLNQQVQNLATPKNLSDPFLTEWVKSPHNPLLVPADGIDPQLFRDPTTAWRGADAKWRVLVGTRIDEGRGAAALYRYEDFVGWEKASAPLHSSNGTGMWECPDFYPVKVNGENGLDASVFGVGVRHVLKASFGGCDWYVIGSYDSKTDRFKVGVDFGDERARLRYDYGVLYASKTFYDGGENRRVLWGWVTEADSEDDDVVRGWSGLQSIPRTILLDKNKKQLIQWPIEELEKLRGEEVTLENEVIKSGEMLEISGITASQVDVEVSFLLQKLEGVELIKDPFVDPGLLCSQMNASVKGVFGPFGLLVLASEDLTEKTAVFFRVFKSNYGKHVVLMCCDQSRSSVKAQVKEPFFGSFLDVDPNEEISLRTLIDHSIVESFGGKGKSCITARVYPKLAISENSHIYAFNNGKRGVVISSLSAWSMHKAQMTQVRKRRKPSLA